MDSIVSIKYVAFDPGETTGWATFDDSAELVAFGQVKREALYELLSELATGEPPEVCVIEEFTLYQSKARQQSGSKMEATRVIGVLEAWAYGHKMKVVMQPASIKAIAEKWSGLKPPSDHSRSHKFDAYNHGVYYLVKNGLRKPEIARQK